MNTQQFLEATAIRTEIEELQAAERQWQNWPGQQLYSSAFRDQADTNKLIPLFQAIALLHFGQRIKDLQNQFEKL